MPTDLTTNPITMKTISGIILGRIFGLATTILLSHASFAQAKETGSIGIVILDDQLDPGLAREGIKPLQAPDLDPLINAAINSRRAILLRHLPIMRDAKDAPVAALEFTPFAGGPKPEAPTGNLAYRDKLKAAENYRNAFRIWEKKFEVFAETVRGDGRASSDLVIANQLLVTETHDRLLIVDNGRERKGLDLVGAITHANDLLAECEIRILVINSPCADRSVVEGKRTEVLKPAELDPSVQLVFVNTSRRPQQIVLFKGLPNSVIAQGSLVRALTTLSEKLGGRE